MNSKYVRILIPLTLVATFFLDTVTPLGYEVYIGHIFAVLLAIWIERPNAPYIIAAIATILVILEFGLSPPGIPLGMAVFNRTIGIALFWMAAALVVRAKTAKLDDATRRLGAIVESTSDAILSVTPEGAITSWNIGAERMFGYTATEMLGRSILTLIPANLRDDEASLQAVLCEGRGIRTDDAVRVTKDGRNIAVSVTLSPLNDAAGRFIGVSKIIRDISERKRSELLLQRTLSDLEKKVQERTSELKSANDALRELSGRLMQVQETERTQLARDLHDETGQLLTALKIDLQGFQHAEDAEARSRSLSDSLELVNRLLMQVRNLALDLRPSLLDDLGLEAALRWYANRQAGRNGWTLSFTVDGMTERIPAPIEIACFRIVQEAITNIAKHASARTVSLTLRREDWDVRLGIQDDGVGFDLALARQRAQGGESMGLLGMEERVRLAGGTMTISSTRGQGTTIQLRFPLMRPQQAESRSTVEVMSP